MPLNLFLAAILSGSIGLGPLIYKAICYFDLLKNTPPKRKRLLIAVLAGLLGIICWEASAILGFITVVPTISSIVDACWTYGVLMGFSAFTSSQVIHAQKATPDDRPVS